MLRSLSLIIRVLAVLLFPGNALALSPDESLLFNRARVIAEAPIEDFNVLDHVTDAPDSGYRYQIAFLAYGVCSVVKSDPSLRNEGRAILTRFIEKMEYPTTTAYWKRLGYEGDGLTKENVMYRGHLNLMYALAHDRFGETRFDSRFHALSKSLFEEISGKRPICCEPDQVFIQCNAVTVLSLFLHDRSFGTSYASAGKRLLAWARQNMPLSGTALVREDYHPSTGQSSARRSGCANAWIIAFLAPVPGLEKDARAMYADWRRLFVQSAPFPGMVRGAPVDEPVSLQDIPSTLLAMTFGLLAAREEGDEALHLSLEFIVSCMEDFGVVFDEFLPPTLRSQARTFRTLSLFARSFRGWSDVLELEPREK
jgi:hypothetical protein